MSQGFPVVDELAAKRMERIEKAMRSVRFQGQNLDWYLSGLVHEGIEIFEIKFHLLMIARWLETGGAISDLGGTFVTTLMVHDLVHHRVFASHPEPVTYETMALANHMHDSVNEWLTRHAR